MQALELNEHTATLAQKLTAAVAFAVASTLIMFVNKLALTGYHFPSFMTIAGLQALTSICVLLFQRKRGTVKAFPIFDWTAFKSVFPVPIFFLFNTVSGLGATDKLSMPMFVLLRRFSIVMTMCLEFWVLGRRYHPKLVAAITLMMMGAMIASTADMTFKLSGVVLITINNLATAFQGVLLMKKMKELANTNVGTPGIMFYNNVVSLTCISIVLMFNGDIENLLEFGHWDNPVFLAVLASTAGMGFVLNFCYYWCTRVNSPTTTAVVGAFKNIMTSFVGMLFSDYVHTDVAFIGICTSAFGSCWYNFEELQRMRSAASAKAHSAASASAAEKGESTAAHSVAVVSKSALGSAAVAEEKMSLLPTSITNGGVTSKQHKAIYIMSRDNNTNSNSSSHHGQSADSCGLSHPMTPADSPNAEGSEQHRFANGGAFADRAHEEDASSVVVASRASTPDGK